MKSEEAQSEEVQARAALGGGVGEARLPGTLNVQEPSLGTGLCWMILGSFWQEEQLLGLQSMSNFLAEEVSRTCTPLTGQNRTWSRRDLPGVWDPRNSLCSGEGW